MIKMRYAGHNVMSFLRVWKLSGSRLTFRRKFSTYDKSKDCDSQTVPEEDPCCPSVDDDPCSKIPPCPPELPPYYWHYDPNPKFWRMLSLLSIPVVVIMSGVTYVRYKEHEKRPREPFLNLPYMHIRTKPFPWGDGNHSLFHNPVKNPVPPHGYEAEDPYETPKKKSN